MYRFKFVQKRTVYINYFAVVALVLLTVLAYFAGLMNGLNYIY